MKFILSLWLFAMTLLAQEAALPAQLSSWGVLSYVQTATKADEVQKARLQLNKASFIGLQNTPKIEYILTPQNEGGSVSYGGMFEFSIEEKGIYRVALGNASWIDVLKGDKAMKSIGHKHGPEGSGIRKMIDFSLTQTGTYTLQLAAGADSTSAVLITKIKE